MKKARGFGRVFSFTFRRQTTTGGWRSLTAVIALLCFLIPAAVLGIMALHTGNTADEPEYVPDHSYELPLCRAETVYITDETENPITDWNFLQALHPEAWGEMVYATAANPVDGKAVCLRLTRTGGVYKAAVSLPEGSALTEDDVLAYESFLWDAFPSILQVKAGLTADQLDMLYGGVEFTIPEQEQPQTDPMADVKEMLGMILPYLGVMVMYFLILFYGQGVANSVVLEKSSKLMDFFLVSVEPTAMVMGKVLAMAAAGLLQLAIWLVSLSGGFALGIRLCRTIAPDAQFGILTFFDSLSLFEGMFSLPAVVLAVAIVLGGFLIYCALAGVGGALAGKAEDLGSTNVLFSLTLVASFLICLLGGSGDETISSAAWLDFVPFTAILVTPARVLLGNVPLWQGAVTLAIVMLTAAALCVLAGKVYRMMSLYKGDPPTPRKMVTMLINHK